MTTPYTTGTITLTNGSAVVEGDGTAWELALIVGGVLYHDGRALPIESVESDTSLTLAIVWPEATVAAAAYAIVRDTDLAQQSVENAIALSALIKELQSATWFQYNAAGNLAGRDGYDNRTKGFVYLDISVTPFEMYIKASNDEGDWAGPNRYAQGEQGVVGPEGPFGPPGIDWKGTYSGATAYVERDVVRDNGSAWIALQDTTGNAPPVYPTTSNAHWELLAVKGQDGTGTGDVVGPLSSADGDFVVFDGTTGKLLKTASAATMKAALAILAAEVSFDNTAAGLDGDPDTVQAAIDAIAEALSDTGSSSGLNDALFALEIADLKGQRMGMVGGAADAFDDETGVDAGTSSNYAYDAANDRYQPSSDVTEQLFGAASGTANQSDGTYVDVGSPLTTGDVITAIGFHNTPADASAAVKILKRNSPGNYDVVVNEAFSHPGGGMATKTLTTPYTVPAGGNYHVGAYRSATAVNSTRAASTTRAQVVGNATGTGVSIGEGSSINLPPFRVLKNPVIHNMTLTSVAYTAGSAPAEGRIALQLADTLSLVAGTDFTMEVSRDGGTTWSAITMTLTMALFGGVKLYEGTVSVAAQPTGTSMKWRLKTLTNKAIIASGVVLQWS